MVEIPGVLEGADKLGLSPEECDSKSDRLEVVCPECPGELPDCLDDICVSVELESGLGTVMLLLDCIALELKVDGLPLLDEAERVKV